MALATRGWGLEDCPLGGRVRLGERKLTHPWSQISLRLTNAITTAVLLILKGSLCDTNRWPTYDGVAKRLQYPVSESRQCPVVLVKYQPFVASS